mgnify:CR=1 FL=1
MEFKDTLKLLREESKLNKKELAEKLKLSPSAISMYESGDRMPSIEVLDAVSDYFNVDADYLLGKQDEKRKISFDFLKEKCELECYFGMLSAKNDDLDLEFMREYVQADKKTKQLLLHLLKSQRDA